MLPRMKILIQLLASLSRSVDIEVYCLQKNKTNTVAVLLLCWFIEKSGGVKLHLLVLSSVNGCYAFFQRHQKIETPQKHGLFHLCSTVVFQLCAF